MFQGAYYFEVDLDFAIIKFAGFGLFREVGRGFEDMGDRVNNEKGPNRADIWFLGRILSSEMASLFAANRFAF